MKEIQISQHFQQRMNNLCDLIRVLMILVFAAGSAVAEKKVSANSYEGEVNIPNIGTVSFPKGKWILEFENFTAPDKARRKFVVFKKTGETLERLTFVVYPYSKNPRSYLGTIGEILGDGVPPEARTYETAGKVYALDESEPADSPDPEEPIRFSFITVGLTKNTNWICHSVTQSQKKSGLLLITAHTSTSVIDPSIVSDVAFESQFSREEKE